MCAGSALKRTGKMSATRTTLLGVAMLFLALPSLRAQEAFTLEPAVLPKNAPVSAALRQLLQSQGSQIITTTNGLKAVVCELWWAKAVAGPAKTVTERDILYGEVTPGALLGLLYFPTENEDSRDQKLKAGYYTMRYAQIPPPPREDQDASPFHDFAALIPLNSDTEAEQALPEDKLLQLSRRASRTELPALMDLVPANQAYKNSPALINDDSGRCVMQIKLHSGKTTRPAGKELTVAILLITPPKEAGGS